jgi:hypothetical protein
MRMAERQGWVPLALMLALAGCGGMEPVELLAEDAEAEYAEGALGNEQWGLDNVRVTLGSSQERGEPRWALHPKGPGHDMAQAVAHDRDGNIIVGGAFDNQLEGDGLTIQSGVPFTPLLVKLRPDGGRIWAKIVAEGEAVVTHVATDRHRNILVLGNALENIDFGQGRLLEGIFLAKFDPKGRVIWARTFDRFGPAGLAVDRHGDIYVAGNTVFGEVDLGLGPFEPPSGSDSLGFLAKFSPTGALLWQRATGAEARYQHRGLIVDSHDQVYVTGATFERRPFLDKRSPTGHRLWSRELDTEGWGADVAVHGNRVVVAGPFADAFSFRGRTYAPSARGGEGFLVAYTRGGEERWARVLGAVPSDIAMDPRDGLIVTGNYTNGADLGTGPMYGAAEGGNFYVSKYDRIHGEVRWVRTFPSSAVRPLDVAPARNGESTIVGALDGPADFGFGRVAPSGWQSDLFILRLGR